MEFVHFFIYLLIYLLVFLSIYNLIIPKNCENSAAVYIIFNTYLKSHIKSVCSSRLYKYI